MKLNKKGFSVVEGLLVVAVVGVIGVVGWIVYDRQYKKDQPKAAQITNFEQCKAAGYPIAESYPEQCSANGQTFVNNVELKAEGDHEALLYSDTEQAIYSISKLATTPEQKSQAAALDAECGKNGTGAVAATGTKDLFTEKSDNYVAAGNFARFNASCYVPKGGPPSIGGASHYVEKKDGTWTLLGITQMSLPCSQVDNKQAPAAVVGQCIDGDQIRAPKQ